MQERSEESGCAAVSAAFCKNMKEMTKQNFWGQGSGKMEET